MLIFVPPLIWLGLKLEDESSVKCSIKDFYVTVPQNNTNTAAQSIIYFDLKLENYAATMGAYYNNLILTFSYVNVSSNISGIIPLANYTVQGFHQGIEKDTHRKGFVLAAAGGAPWKEGTSKVVFRVNLETAVRFKDIFWMGKRYKLLAEADVEIDGNTGKKLSKKDIVLKNMHNHHVSRWAVFGFVLACIGLSCTGCICVLVMVCVTCARNRRGN